VKKHARKSKELIGEIYESIGDTEAVGEAVMGLTRLSESRSAQFGILDGSGRWLQATVVGVDPVALDLYLNQFVGEDRRLEYCLRHQGQLYPCHHIIQDAGSWERTGLVNEVLNRYEARFALCTTFPVSPRYSAALCMMRGRRDGRYGTPEEEELAPLLPHIQRALSLHIRMGRLESHAGSMEELVNRLRTPVMLIDRGGKLKHANSAGHLALNGANHLTLRNGRIEPANPDHLGHFDDLLMRVFFEDPDSLGNGNGTSMRVVDEGGRAATLTAYRLRGLPGLKAMSPAEVVLFLTYSDADSEIDVAPLQILFGLTAAETRLAALLVRGTGLAEICRSLHVSRETVKSHLESLFDKTGTRRQSELVALLHGSVSSLLR
jgi:DNA-binding CsgD family transcriptional regulator